VKRLILSLLFLIVHTTYTSAAVKVVECKDAEGNIFFSKTCPPGSEVLDEKKIATGSKAAQENVTSKAPIRTSSISGTMYMIPSCSPCDGVRELFKANSIPLTEKNVEGNIDLQTELTELNGSLNVPITVIGDRKLSGYNRSELISALKDAGWQDPNEVKEETPEPEP